MINYYATHDLPINIFTPNEIIRQGRLDILDWMFSIKIIHPDVHSYLIESAIMFNDIFIIDYLMKYHNICPTNTIYEMLDNEFRLGMINKVMLSWLWGNNIKWSYEVALKYNNEFMLNFFK